METALDQLTIVTELDCEYIENIEESYIGFSITAKHPVLGGNIYLGQGTYTKHKIGTEDYNQLIHSVMMEVVHQFYLDLYLTIDNEVPTDLSLGNTIRIYWNKQKSEWLIFKD